jgi:hypothetical protein
LRTDEHLEFRAATASPGAELNILAVCAGRLQTLHTRFSMAKTNTTPTISFGTLAKLMGPTTPAGQVSLLRGHKYPTDGPKRGYQNARAQLIDHLVEKKAYNPHSKLRPYEREAIDLLRAEEIPVPADLAYTRPSTANPHWAFEGVNVSVFPDVDIANREGRGAMKAHFAKDSLARGVGASMAALLWFYKTEILREQAVASRNCLVYEVRNGHLHVCGSPNRLLANASAACRVIVALWPTL